MHRMHVEVAEVAARFEGTSWSGRKLEWQRVGVADAARKGTPNMFTDPLGGALKRKNEEAGEKGQGALCVQRCTRKSKCVREREGESARAVRKQATFSKSWHVDTAYIE